MKIYFFLFLFLIENFLYAKTVLLITPRVKYSYKKDAKLRKVIKKLCKCRVRTAYYKYVTPKTVKKISPFAIIISGQNTPWSRYYKKDLKGIKEIILNTKIPLFGICGGHQLIAMTYGGILGWVNKKYEGKKSYKNCKRVKGRIKLDAFVNDGLFNGIDLNSRFLTKHCQIVKNINDNFIVLASYRDMIYAMKHKSKIIYSTQFHPEFTKDGIKLLGNFLDIAGKTVK